MTVSIWIFAPVILFMATTIAILSYLHFWSNPLPFPDWGNSVFVCPDEDARTALFEALDTVVGVKPDRRIESALADRALFMNRYRFIVNITNPNELDSLGNPVAGLAIVVKYPGATAHQIVDILTEHDFDSQHVLNPDPDVPEGAMAFVQSDAFPGWLLVLRKPLTQMGPRPPKWSED